MKWQRLVESQSGTQAERLRSVIDAATDAAIASSADDHIYDELSAELSQIMACCMATATQVFGLTKARPPHPTQEHTRKTFLPRALGKIFKHHNALRGLCYAYHQLIIRKIHSNEMSLDQLREHPKAIAFHLMFPKIAKVPNTAALLKSKLLKAVLAQLSTEKRAMAECQTKHHTNHFNKRARYLRHLLYTNPSKGHKIVFGTGTTTHVTAINHPLHGVVSTKEHVLEGVDYSQRLLYAQAMPAHLATTPPYNDNTPNTHETAMALDTNNDPLPDPFKIDKRGSEASLFHHLSRPTFDDCLHNSKNGKATGPDMLPNELLKHMPEQHLSMLYAFFRYCWITGRTPDSWQGSTTLLFYKNKGSTTDPANYRPIALHNHTYKLWTQFIHKVISNYAESKGIIGDSQEGFQEHHNTKRQADHFVSICEDAHLSKKDIFALKLDFASAFNRVDHDRLFFIMAELGIPPDAIKVVKGLYSGAKTRIRTTLGETEYIQVTRGTIQGDSLSPYLFLLFMEPLTRWLKAGGRGYRVGCIPAQGPHGQQECISDDTYADDIILLTDCHKQMIQQIRKVQAYCTYTGMSLNPQKSELSAILYGAAAASREGSAKQQHKPNDWGIIRPILQQITICGHQVKLIPPDEPFRVLGMLITLSLNWEHQLNAAKQLIKKKGDKILSSAATMQQKWKMEEHCTLAALEYGFSTTPYKPADLLELDKIRARYLRKILFLPSDSSTDLLFLPATALGCQFRPSTPSYVQIAGQTLVTNLSDKGRLGTITRALCIKHVRKQSKNKADYPSLARPRPCWKTSQMRAMCLRRAAWVEKYGLHISTPESTHSFATDPADLKETLDDCIRMYDIHISPHDLHEMILIPLWHLHIHYLHHLVVHSPQEQHVMDRTQFSHQWPHSSDLAKQALQRLTSILCRQCLIITHDNGSDLHETASHRLIPHKFRVSTLHEQTPPIDALPNLQATPILSPPTTQGDGTRATASPTTRPQLPQVKFWPPEHYKTSNIHNMRTAVQMRPRDLERLAHLIQIERASSHPSTHLHTDPELAVCTVTWRDTCRIGETDKKIPAQPGISTRIRI
jgi:hypothetical protein